MSAPTFLPHLHIVSSLQPSESPRTATIMPPDDVVASQGDKNNTNKMEQPKPQQATSASTPDGEGDEATATAEAAVEDKETQPLPQQSITKRVSWSAEAMPPERATPIRTTSSSSVSSKSSSRRIAAATRNSLSKSVKNGSKYFRKSAVSMRLVLDSLFCEAGQTLTGTLVVDVNRFFVLVDAAQPLALTIQGQEATQVDYFAHETPGKGATVGHDGMPSGHYGKRRATEVRTIWEQNCTLSEEGLLKLWERNKEEDDNDNNNSNDNPMPQDTTVRKLYKGTHKIPFSVALPDHLPGTMRMDHKRRLGRRKFLHHNLCVDHARIQYELTATLKKGAVTEHNISFRRNKSARNRSQVARSAAARSRSQMARSATTLKTPAPTATNNNAEMPASLVSRPYQCVVEVKVTPKEPRQKIQMPYDSGESVHKVKRCGYLYCGKLSQQICIDHCHLQPGQDLKYSIVYQNRSSTAHAPHLASVKVTLKEKIDWYAEAVSKTDDSRKGSDKMKHDEKKHDSDNSSHKHNDHEMVVKRRNYHFSQDLATQELLANEHDDSSVDIERERSFCLPTGEEEGQNTEYDDVLLKKPAPQFTASTLLTNNTTTTTTTSISSSSLKPEADNAENTTKQPLTLSERTSLRHPAEHHHIVSFSGQLLIPKIYSHSTYPLPPSLTRTEKQQQLELHPLEEESKEQEQEEKMTESLAESAAANKPNDLFKPSSPLITVRHELVIKTQLKHCTRGIPERRIPVYITDLDLTRRSMLSTLHDQPQLQGQQQPEPGQRGISNRSTKDNLAAGQRPLKHHSREGNLRDTMLSGVKAKGSIKRMSWKAVRQKMAKGSRASPN